MVAMSVEWAPDFLTAESAASDDDFIKASGGMEKVNEYDFGWLLWGGGAAGRRRGCFRSVFHIFFGSWMGTILMNTKRIIGGVWMAALALASASAHASDRSYTDHELASRDGKKWITRTAALTDFDGGQVVVELRLFEDGKGGLVYRYDDQTEATKLYHQASCEETGAEVRRGDTILGGESVAAWSCTGVADKQAESEKSTERTDAPRAAYYVHALAPSGSAPLGVNFHSVGIARYQSSIAGGGQWQCLD